VSTGLKESFGTTITSCDKRLIKAQIENEELVEITNCGNKGSWEEDLIQIQSLLDKEKPCYVLFRLDSSNPQWVLFCYVPDKAKVKDKMLYASSRSNLKQQLGMNYFVDEVFGTVPSDFTLEGYKHHVQSKKK